jgi:hypothetical protein
VGAFLWSWFASGATWFVEGGGLGRCAAISTIIQINDDWQAAMPGSQCSAPKTFYLLLFPCPPFIFRKLRYPHIQSMNPTINEIDNQLVVNQKKLSFWQKNC